MDLSASVRAQSEDEAWCAEAVEAVHCYLKQFKQWYSLLYIPFLYFFALIVFNILLILGETGQTVAGIVIPELHAVHWVAFLFFMVLIISREKVLPPASRNPKFFPTL